ncbi:hypothetical protein HYDPIDRAFT_107746 [Hydnomerulius pinastri MD-312]|nr:hypothetical protein HYDPIDRAFT_107746 [Hydnomerulius pinastri MD-312]
MLSDTVAPSQRPYRSRTSSLEVASSHKPTSPGPVRPDGAIRHSSPSYSSSIVSREVRHIRVLHRRAVRSAEDSSAT